MSQRDIAATIEDIYGFQMSHEQISTITGCVMEEVEAWRNRPLQSFYPFAFVDCIYVSLRTEYGVQQLAVYVMLACLTSTGCKDVLASGSTRRRASMPGCRSSTSCENRGVKDLGILSMDGVSGLEERRQGCIPACHGSALHRTPHPQFHPLHPTQAVECIHEAAEAHLWCHQRQAGPSGIREVQDRLAGLSRRGSRMGKQFLTLSSSITMAVPCARSCTRPMPSRASTLASAR